MRKIEIKEDREKRESRNRIIIGVVLVGIMIISSAGYAFYSEKEEFQKIKYNGKEFFLKEDGLWHFQIDNVEFATSYNPKDTENISVGNLNIQNYYGNALYFSYDSDAASINEISRNMGNFISRMQLVCLSVCDKDLPVKNCSSNVIIVKEQNETLIKQEENCVYIFGKKEELVRASDAFLFNILKI